MISSLGKNIHDPFLFGSLLICSTYFPSFPDFKTCMHDNYPSMHFFFRKWNWEYDSAHLEIFCKSWDLELAAMLSPFLVLRGYLEELCKFWILELTVVPLEQTRVRSLPLMRLVVLPDLLMWLYSRPGRRSSMLKGTLKSVTHSTDEIRQRLIALKDEEFYKIMVSNRPWVTDDHSIVPKRTFFFCDAVPNDSTYQRKCFHFSYIVDGERRNVSTRSTFDRTISIMCLSSTCLKREDPPSWVKRENVIKTGVFIGGPSGFAEKSPTHMDILMPASGYQGSDHLSVDLGPVGLGIFKGDGNNWFLLVAFYDFLKEKEASKVRCSSWKSGSSLSLFSSFFDSGESSESTTQEAKAKNLDSKKISTMRETLKELFASTDAIDSNIALRRDLAVYLTYWLGKAIFAGGEAAAFQVRLGLPMNKDVEMGQSSVKLSPGLRKKAFDFGVSSDSTRAGSGRHYSLTNTEKMWLFNIHVGTMAYHRQLFVDIQPYVPSRFALQLGFSQGVVRAPLSKVRRFGGLQDGRNTWAFYSAEDTTAMISYPELPTFRTAGFTKWFVESFSVYRGLSKKELDVKQSSWKGLGKSDGVRRSGAAQEIPSEVLEQLVEEEAEVTAWIQAERAKASMESIGKSRPSSEASGERPDFNGGAGTSSHMSKRRKGQCRSKRRHENSTDLEVPSTIAEEASWDDDEPLEKKSRGEKISSDEDDGLVMPKVSANEAVMNMVMASEEEPRESEVDPESPPADLPEDSEDFEPSMDATFDDASDELMEAKSIPPVVEEGEVPLSFSEPEQGVPAADPRVGASSTSFDEDILSDSEEVGLDITNAKAFVDEVIALGNKWNETKNFLNGDFFNEMFLKPSSEVKFEMDKISRTWKQLVQERNVTELAIFELAQDQHHLEREVTEARQCLELLEEQAAAKWTTILKACDRERSLIRQVEEAESNLPRKTQEYE
ncbi:hypothetical protein AAC387_Pa05g1049 [Persea americana]